MSQLTLFSGAWAAAAAAGEPAAGPAPTRPYQLDVLDRTRKRIASGLRRGVIQGETGSGKTRLYAELCRGVVAKEKAALILADRRRLVSQIGWELEGFHVPYGVVMAGSTRDVQAPVILATRDTLAAWAAAGRAVRPFDLVVVDECHRALGAVYQQLLSLFPQAVHIGGTATPARGDGKSLGDFYQFLECMVPASQLIEQGYLVRPEVKAPLDLATKRRSGHKTKGRAGCPVSHWRRYADGLPTIAFAGSIAESLGLRDRFLAAGVPAEHVDGSAADDVRDRAFRRLERGETLVLCTVKIAIEGVDLPAVAAAILWAPFGSLVEYRQACGRIMRPAPGKCKAVVLDHLGAAGVHGLPGDDLRWSLDAAGSVGDRRAVHIAAGKLAAVVYCPECGLAFAGEACCPSCGWRRPRERRKPVEPVYKARDELLVPYDGPTAEMVADEQRERFWRKCVAVAANKGAKASMAVVMFQRKYGVPPWAAGVHPLAGRGDWGRPAADVFPGYARGKAKA